MTQINGIINTNTNFSINKKEEKKVNEEVSKDISQSESSVKVPQGTVLASFGVVQSPSFGKKEKIEFPKSPEFEYVENLPFSKELTTMDKINLSKVLEKKDEQTGYMQQLIDLACEGKVTPFATKSLCSHGKMNDFVVKDLKTYNHAKENNIPLEEAFCPTFASQKEANKNVEVGDVFKVEGEDNIYVKYNGKESEQLKMDRETYMELFPPISRFASSQGHTGDCYLLSSINSMMENPRTRSALYECFTQKGNDIEVQLPNGKATAVCPNKKLPETADLQKYTTGPMGMKMLEHIYGKELDAVYNEQYDTLVQDEIAGMKEELADLKENQPQNDATLKKQQSLEKKIGNWEAGRAKVEEARKNHDDGMVFVIDEYGDFVIGKNGPITKSAEKLDSSYKNAPDYYRGANGGTLDEAMVHFGFANVQYYTVIDDEAKLDKALNAANPDKYIITASTYSSEDGGMEQAQETEYSIYSSHAYKILPYDSEDGERRFKVTNPWNQSHMVDMDMDKLKEYFEDFAVSKVG